MVVLAKKILILGGEGFIGRSLSEILSSDSQCYSVGLRKSIFGGNKAIFLSLDPYSDKITDHYDVVIQLIDNAIPLDDVVASEQKIFESIKAILPQHVILFSTASIYMFPESEYSRRKLLLESQYQQFCEKQGIRLSILRLFNIFGPYQLPGRRGSLVANIIYQQLKNEPIEINDLSARRDFIYSHDMAECVRIIINKKLSGLDDLATNKLTTISTMIENINRCLPTEVSIVNKQCVEKEISPQASSRIVNQIKLTPIDESLKETIRFYQENYHLIQKR